MVEKDTNDNISNKSVCFDYESNVEIFGENETYPQLGNEVDNAKSFLKKPSKITGDNLYDHLSDVLNKLLAERPENVIDFFEDYSRKVKEIRYRDATDHLRDIFVPPQETKHQVAIKYLLTPIEKSSEETEEEEETENKIFIDPMDDLYYYEQIGVGIPRHEMYILSLSLRRLINSEPLKSLRFWGKIFGLEADYYIAEGALSEAGIAQLLEEEQEEEQEEAVKKEEDEEETEEEEINRPKIPRKKPPIPKPPKIETVTIPTETYGTGANKKVYYVCNQPGVDKWIKLPNVIPKQIQVARQIIKYFTGNLEQPIDTWPIFPGVEKNYLRAQIGRITAGTEVAPAGMFSFTEDTEEEENVADEEDETIKTEIYRNKNYEPVPLKDLNDGAFSFWVHTTLNILQKQGRCTWWNPNKEKPEDETEVEEEGEDKIEKETGPPLLNPLSEDVYIQGIKPWTVRFSSKLTPDNAFAIIRSNLWPGAYSFTMKQKIGFIYFGSGHKYNVWNYSPPPLPFIMEEYPIGPEIMEIIDASGAEEKAWIIAHEQKVVAEDEEEEMEEEEDDDEDDDN